MEFEFRVTVSVERESGKFASRDEIAEKITEALEEMEENIDLDGVGADSESVYVISEFSANEVDPKKKGK